MHRLPPGFAYLIFRLGRYWRKGERAWVAMDDSGVYRLL